MAFEDEFMDMIREYPDEHLRAMNSIIVAEMKYRRSIQANAVKRQLRIGAKVYYESAKTGRMDGIVKEILQKNAVVAFHKNGMPVNYRVALSALNLAE